MEKFRMLLVDLENMFPEYFRVLNDHFI